MADKATVAVGPWGETPGFSDWNDGTDFDSIRKITVYASQFIHAIGVTYDKGGVAVNPGTHGSTGTNSPTQIELDFPGEIIIKVSGHYGTTGSAKTPVVKSLKFTTNYKTIDPIGIEEGTPFSLPVKGGRIVSFFGTNSQYLSTIGFHVGAAY